MPRHHSVKNPVRDVSDGVFDMHGLIHGRETFASSRQTLLYISQLQQAPLLSLGAGAV